jgi:hypothetical protein
MKCGFEALMKVLNVVPNFIIGNLDFSKQLNVNQPPKGVENIIPKGEEIHDKMVAYVRKVSSLA